MCKECIKKHIKNKNNFKVKCIPFAESLNSLNNPYYPLDKVLGEDKYSELSDDVKIEIQLSKNKLLWAKETLGWSTMNPERGFDQFYQREILLCTAKMKVVRCGRRMGKTEYIIIESLHTAINENRTKILIYSVLFDSYCSFHSLKTSFASFTLPFFISLIRSFPKHKIFIIKITDI